MSTATVSQPLSAMSKKERKAHRKALVEKKKQLLAKRNAPKASTKPRLPADPRSPRKPDPRAPRGLRNPNPSMPEPPAAATATAKVVAKPLPAASRHVAWPVSGQRKPLNQLGKDETPKRRAQRKAQAVSGVAQRTPSRWAQKNGSTFTSTVTSEPTATSTSKPTLPAAKPAVTAPAPGAQIEPTGMPEPGPLQRGAAMIEAGVRRAVWFAGRAGQWLRVEPGEASAYGSLPGVVWPLRVCGVLSAIGAVAMAVQAEAMPALVLGFGMGIAIIQLALAEIARAVWGMIRGS